MASKFLRYIKAAAKAVSRKPPNIIQRDNPRQRTQGIVSNRVRAYVERPLVDPVVWTNMASSIWIIRAAVEKIVEEANTGLDFRPRFAVKCRNCGEESQEEPDDGKCGNCGHEDLRKPDATQIESVRKLFSHPNSDKLGRVFYPANRLLGDALWYNQVMDDWFWEIAYGIDGNPAEIWPIPAEFIRHIEEFTDEIELYCPNCWTEDESTYKPEEKEEGEPCPQCAAPLEVTEWVQLADDGSRRIISRFSAKRLLHGNSKGYGGRRWGIPKMLAVYYIAQTLRWQEMRQWSAYSQDLSADKALVFPGMSQESVQDMAYDVMEMKRRIPGKQIQLWMGAQDPPVVVDLAPNMVDLQAKDMAEYYREAVAIVYGVSLQMLGIQVPGKLGKETEMLQVSYDTIESAQRSIDTFVNTQFLPLFKTRTIDGKEVQMVRDWEAFMPPARKEDLARKVQVAQANVQLAMSLEQMGFPVDLDSMNDFRPVISGPRKPESERQPPAGAVPPIPFTMSRGMSTEKEETAYLMNEVTGLKQDLRRIREERRGLMDSGHWKNQVTAVELLLDDLFDNLDDVFRGASRIGTIREGEGLRSLNPRESSRQKALAAAKALASIGLLEEAAKVMDIYRRLESPLGEPPGFSKSGATLSKGDWVRYEGPRGGRGWRNTRTGEILYQDEKPGEGAAEEEPGPIPEGTPLKTGKPISYDAAPKTIRTEFHKSPQFRKATQKSFVKGIEVGMPINRTEDGSLTLGEMVDGEEDTIRGAKSGDTGFFHTHPGEDTLDTFSRADLLTMLRFGEQVIVAQNTDINTNQWVAVRTADSPELSGKKRVEYELRTQAIRRHTGEPAYERRYIKSILKEAQRFKIRLYYGDIGEDLVRIETYEDYQKAVMGE